MRANGFLTPSGDGWRFEAQAGAYAIHCFIARPRYMAPDATGGFRLYALHVADRDLKTLAAFAGVPCGKLHIPPRGAQTA